MKPRFWGQKEQSILEAVTGLRDWNGEDGVCFRI